MKIFFRSPDANFSLCSQNIEFPKVFYDIQKWTFINVQFPFLEKGFGVKNRKNAMSGAHNPQPPTTHKWHPIIFYYRSILLHPDIVREAHLYPLLPFCSPFSVSLLYSFKRENITFLGSPEMSDKSIYE